MVMTSFAQSVKVAAAEAAAATETEAAKISGLTHQNKSNKVRIM